MAASAIPMGGVRPRKTVLLTANKGGVGKTTTGVHLAACAVREGLKVTLIDTDPQRDTASWIKGRRKHAVPEIQLVEADIENYHNALVQASDSDLVIIDTKPGIVGDGLDAMHGLARIVDLVLIPTSLSNIDLRQVIPWATKIREATGKYPSFILNRIRSNVSGGEMTAVQNALQEKGKVAPRYIRNLVDIERWTGEGLTVTEGEALGADDMASLWSFVKKEIDLG